MNIYLASSWKNRTRVRALAEQLRDAGFEVYDFTDPRCRDSEELPPERFPDRFDPGIHVYREYIERPEFRKAVEGTRSALDRCDIVILMLPCGADSHSDWAFAVGRRKITAVIGHPLPGERTPTHLWADALLDRDEDVIPWLRSI